MEAQMSRGPIWFDTDVLINLEKGKPGFEAALRNLKTDGYELLITPSVEREFLYGGKSTAQDAVGKQALLTQWGVQADKTAYTLTMKELQSLRDSGIANGLSITDADIVAQVKASATARGIKNPIYLTKDAGGTLDAMARRGVKAMKFDPSTVRAQLAAEAPPPPPVEPPTGGAGAAAVETESSASRIWTAAKAGLKAGLKDAVKAENLAAMIPDVILMVADKVAARDAVRAIRRKFLKEGFAKGVAAGAMEWTEREVYENLMNHVTAFRVQGMADPAGFLTLSYMLRLAESQENYAVALGYEFSRQKTLDWRKAMLKDGLESMKNYDFVFEVTAADGTKSYSRRPNDQSYLFEYDFINKLSYVISPKTNPIIENAMR
jgi:hypothetical protein